VRANDGAVVPLIGLTDAYKLRLGRLWEIIPRDVLRRGLAVLAGVVSESAVSQGEIATRLAEAANGEITQSAARSIVSLVRFAEGLLTDHIDDKGRHHVRAKPWVHDAAIAEARLDEAALARMGPFLPVDPAAFALALGVTPPVEVARTPEPEPKPEAARPPEPEPEPLAEAPAEASAEVPSETEVDGAA
jgi:hypothetical protein